MNKVVILGGGPGGYEAALVGKQLGGDVTLIERSGLGGAAVLADCVPSKTLIATAEVMTTIQRAARLGLYINQYDDYKDDVKTGSDSSVIDSVRVDLKKVNQRVLDLAAKQSDDIKAKLQQEGVRIITGVGRLSGSDVVVVDTEDGEKRLSADIILVATGTTPRELPDAPCDGERILNWRQIYNLTELPKRMIVVGSGVTGAEFASAYRALGVDVVLVSSREQVLPGEDPDAAAVLQRAFESRGMTIISKSRAVAAVNTGDGVEVHLEDGRTITGTHCLMAVGSIPNTADIGLETAGIRLKPSGHIEVDGVSRTSTPGIYAAGDVTGVFALASVAAMQGRIAMWHSLGDSVAPLDLERVSSNIFTSPEIAAVGMTHAEAENSPINISTVNLPLTSNARAKMKSLRHGFVKLFALPHTGIIVGGVIVAPYASELIHSLAIAVAHRITVEDFSQYFTVYPSLSGSIAEAARRLRNHSEGVTY